MDFLKYLGLIVAIWLFVEGSQPVQFIKGLFDLGQEDDNKNVWKKTLQKLLNCSLCFGFWVGLAYYQSIEFACLTSIGAEIFTRLWNKFIVPMQ